MRVSKDGIKLIKEFEGLRLEAYKCQAGVLSIGWGHTEGVFEGQKISEDEAERLLACDLSLFEAQVLKALNADEIEVNQHQFDALVSFAFNLGVYTLVHGGRNAKVTDTGSIWRNLKAGDYKKAGDAFLLYTKAGGKTSEGLVRRRRAERQRFLTIDYVYGVEDR